MSASLQPRAMALQGVGYTPALLALHGLLPYSSAPIVNAPAGAGYPARAVSGMRPLQSASSRPWQQASERPGTGMTRRTATSNTTRPRR